MSTETAQGPPGQHPTRPARRDRT
ncbi:MAG: hypothetical protein JWP48_4093, partial [Actinoallomurus sp.]|nr:hypothetical protein [Actinoallomurus sp.]